MGGTESVSQGACGVRDEEEVCVLIGRWEGVEGNDALLE